MATIRLHGKKALIIQHFNNLPDITLLEFEWDYTKSDVQFSRVSEKDQCHNLIKRRVILNQNNI